jgi:hypothetical protein
MVILNRYFFKIALTVFVLSYLHNFFEIDQSLVAVKTLSKILYYFDMTKFLPQIHSLNNNNKKLTNLGLTSTLALALIHLCKFLLRRQIDHFDFIIPEIIPSFKATLAILFYTFIKSKI